MTAILGLGYPEVEVTLQAEPHDDGSFTLYVASGTQTVKGTFSTLQELVDCAEELKKAIAEEFEAQTAQR